MNETKKILLVDDDPDVIHHASLVLKNEGFELISAMSRKEAQDRLLSVRPDLAIVDLMMEEEDSGFVLCRDLKRVYPELPVILMTSVRSRTGLSFDGKSAEELSWVKADSFLDKPASPDQLRKEVNRLLGITAEQHH